MDSERFWAVMSRLLQAEADRSTPPSTEPREFAPLFDAPDVEYLLVVADGERRELPLHGIAVPTVDAIDLDGPELPSIGIVRPPITPAF